MVRERPRIIRYLLSCSACMGSPRAGNRARRIAPRRSLQSGGQHRGRAGVLRSIGPRYGLCQEHCLPIMSPADAKMLPRRPSGRRANGRVAQALARMRPHSRIPGDLLFRRARARRSRSSPRCREHRPLPISGSHTSVSSDDSENDHRAGQGGSCKRDRPPGACSEHRDVAACRQGTDAQAGIHDAPSTTCALAGRQRIPSRDLPDTTSIGRKPHRLSRC